MKHLKEYHFDEVTTIFKIFLKIFALRNSSYYICYEFFRTYTMKPNIQISNKLTTAWAVYQSPGVPLHFAHENQQPSTSSTVHGQPPQPIARENQQPSTNN